MVGADKFTELWRHPGKTEFYRKSRANSISRENVPSFTLGNISHESLEQRGSNDTLYQCDQIWRNFVTLAKYYLLYGNFLTVYLVFGKM